MNATLARRVLEELAGSAVAPDLSGLAADREELVDVTAELARGMRSAYAKLVLVVADEQGVTPHVLREQAAFLLGCLVIPAGGSHYAVLGVSPTASADAIRDRWRKLMQCFHPDTFEGNRSWIESHVRRLNAAYSVLRDPTRRAAYDRQLAEARACPPEFTTLLARGRPMPPPPQRRERGLFRCLPVTIRGLAAGSLVAAAVGALVLGVGVPRPVVGPDGEVPQVSSVSDRVRGPWLPGTAMPGEQTVAASDGLSSRVMGISGAPGKQSVVISVDILRESRPSTRHSAETLPLPPAPIKISADPAPPSTPPPMAPTRTPMVPSLAAPPAPIPAGPPVDGFQLPAQTVSVPVPPPPVAPGPSDPPSFPSAAYASSPSTLTLEDALRVVEAYRRAYERRDVNGLLTLMVPHARAGLAAGQEAIRRFHAENFTGWREIVYELHQLDVGPADGERRTVHGRYRIQAVPATGAAQPVVTNGAIRWLIQREEGLVRIVSIDY